MAVLSVWFCQICPCSNYLTSQQAKQPIIPTTTRDMTFQYIMLCLQVLPLGPLLIAQAAKCKCRAIPHTCLLLLSILGGVPASHQGMQAIIYGRYLYKILLKSHNDKTWLNCKEHVYLISGLPGNALKIHIAITE